MQAESATFSVSMAFLISVFINGSNLNKIYNNIQQTPTKTNYKIIQKRYQNTYYVIFNKKINLIELKLNIM